MRIRLSMVLAALPLCVSAWGQAPADNYKVQTKFSAPGDGRWDYITLDAPSRRIFLSHGDEAVVLNADNGKVLGTIPDTPGIHGAMVAGKTGKGYTTNGRENKVSIFDAKTLKVLSKVDVGKGPDAIYYDEKTKRIFTTNHGSHDVTALDAVTGKVLGTIDVKGDGEATVTARDGMMYLNVEDTSEVVRIDPKAMTVVKRFPIEGCKTPTGLDMDYKTNRLFIGCRSKVLAVMDAATGKVITTLPIGTGVDGVVYDPKARMIFASNGDGTLTAIHAKSADVYEAAGTIKTMPGAKTSAIDLKTGRIFLPTAEMMAPPKEGGRPVPKPGTFTVLVVGK